MENEEIYLGGLPPVQVKATNCHTVNVNVKFVVEQRECDTLRQWAEKIRVEANEKGGQLAGLFFLLTWSC